MWEPWKDEGASLNQVTDPPCKACRYWVPMILHRRDKAGRFVFDGVRLCQADEQFHDFSCFKEEK